MHHLCLGFTCMIDNQCANIFSTHATVYGSHSVKFAQIERETIFLQVNPLSFFFRFVSFYLSRTLFFSPKLFFPKLVVFFLFLQGEKLVFNPCCSQGELLLFVGRVVSIFSYTLLRMFSVNLLIGLSLSIRDKKGEKQLKCGNMWENCLFCLGGENIFFDVSNLGGDTMFLVSLLIDLYL